METVNTPEFRVSYPAVFKPKMNDLSGKEEYSVEALFPKGTDLSKLKALAEKTAREKWGNNLPKGLKNPIRDQADKEKTDEATGKAYMPPGTEKGAFFINLKSTRKPGVVNAQVQAIIDPNDFYGGCYAIAVVSCYAYDQKGNKGVAFGLQAIQKTKDGEHFGAAPIDPQTAFKPIESSDDSGESIFS